LTHFIVLGRLLAGFFSPFDRDWVLKFFLLVGIDGDVERELAIPVNNATRLWTGLGDCQNRRVFPHNLQI
jgi:hypothetical protein